MIDLNISNYTGSFAHLNNTNANNQQMNFSTFDITRAFMTVGYPKLITAIRELGVFRFAELFFKARAYITHDNGFYKLSDLYYLLDPSEQRSISYFFGQAFTKLYAEQKLNCIIVDNIHNHKGSILFNDSPTTFTPKLNLFTTKKVSKEPDLIGIQNDKNVHILEAKAYSSGFNGGEFQHAINQVSRINLVNGIVPLTKTACFFDMSGHPIVGKIVDPDDETKNINIDYDNDKFLSNYYSIFKLDNLTRYTFWELDTGKNRYALYRVMHPFTPLIYFGVEMDIFEQLNSEKSIDISKKTNKEISGIDKSIYPEYSLGADGILLLSTNSPILLKNISRKKYY